MRQPLKLAFPATDPSEAPAPVQAACCAGYLQVAGHCHSTKSIQRSLPRRVGLIENSQTWGFPDACSALIRFFTPGRT